MTELQTLLFGKPHPLPPQRTVYPEVGSYGKRSCNYGKAVARVREAISGLKKFTVKDIADITGMDRGTVNRSLIKLSRTGETEKVAVQTAGSERGSAIWATILPS